MCEKIVAPCGIDCFNCEMYEANITKDFLERVSATSGIPQEKIICKGCKDGNICSMLAFQGKKCATLECVKQHKVDFCYQCDDFPCEYLMPLANGADKFPQNIKLYNLCMMKRFGIEGYVERASDIRKTYFTKKIQIGQGGK